MHHPTGPAFPEGFVDTAYLPVASSGFRPHSQRRVRAGIAPASLSGPIQAPLRCRGPFVPITGTGYLYLNFRIGLAQDATHVNAQDAPHPLPGFMRPGASGWCRIGRPQGREVGFEGDGQYWWCYVHGLFSHNAFGRTDYQLIGPADTSGAFIEWLDTPPKLRNYILIHTNDKQAILCRTVTTIPDHDENRQKIALHCGYVSVLIQGSFASKNC